MPSKSIRFGEGRFELSELTSLASPPRPGPPSSPSISGRRGGRMVGERISGGLGKDGSMLETCGNRDRESHRTDALLPVLGLADFIPLPGRGVGAGGPAASGD